MRRDRLFGGAAFAAVGLALATVSPVLAGGGLAVAGGAALLAWLGRCRHGGRLGLLPPTVAADGSRQPARWYCDQCGRAWPAGFDHDTQPVVRFVGYDQTKLPAAARRAAALDRQRQASAVRRAGQAVRHQTAAPAPTNLRSIKDRRAG